MLSSFGGPRSAGSLRAAPWSGPPPAWHPIALAREDPVPGDAAVVAGFAAVSPGAGTARRPSLTAGVVARVVAAPGMDAEGAAAGAALYPQGRRAPGAQGARKAARGAPKEAAAGAAARNGAGEEPRERPGGALLSVESTSLPAPAAPSPAFGSFDAPPTASLASALSLPSAATSSAAVPAAAPASRPARPSPSPSAALLVSTATVHAGASGGALLDASTGRLLGVVTSNARHSVAGIFPRINFSIPAARLAPIADRLERIARGLEPGVRDADGGPAFAGWEALEPLADADVACWTVSRPARNASPKKKAPWSKL